MNHLQQAWASRIAASRRLFHGTDAKLNVGDYLEPGHGSNQYAVQGTDKVFLTDSIGMAYFYAVLGPLQSGRFGNPRVFEVDPEGAKAWAMGEWISDRALIVADVTDEGRQAFKSEWDSTWKPAVQEMATDPATQRILMHEFERRIAAKVPRFIGYVTLDKFTSAVAATGYEAGWLEPDGRVFSINGSHDEYPGETRAAWNSGCMRLIIEAPSLIVEAKQFPNRVQLEALCAITNRGRLHRIVYAFPGGLDNQMFFDSHHEAEQWLRDNLDPSVTSRLAFGPDDHAGWLSPDGTWTYVYVHAEAVRDIYAHLVSTGDVQIRIMPHCVGFRIVKPMTKQQIDFILLEAAKKPNIAVEVSGASMDDIVYQAYESSDQADAVVRSAQNAARSVKLAAADLPEGITFKTYDHGSHMSLDAEINGETLGSIYWARDNMGGDPGEIEQIEVFDPWKRRGIATELYRRAKEIDPRVHHSRVLSPDGRAWSRTTGARKPLMRAINLIITAQQWAEFQRVMDSGDDAVMQWVARAVTNDRGAGMHWSDRMGDRYQTGADSFFGTWSHDVRDGAHLVWLPLLLTAFHDPADVMGDNVGSDYERGESWDAGAVFHRDVEGEHPMRPGGRLWLSEVKARVPVRSWLSQHTPLEPVEPLQRQPGESELDHIIRQSEEDQRTQPPQEVRTYRASTTIEIEAAKTLPIDWPHTTLYHATRPENARAILQQGFRLPDRPVNGADWGVAIYLTDDIDFARGYGSTVLAVELRPDARILNMPYAWEAGIIDRHYETIMDDEMRAVATSHGYVGVADMLAVALYDPSAIASVRKA